MSSWIVFLCKESWIKCSGAIAYHGTESPISFNPIRIASPCPNPFHNGPKVPSSSFRLSSFKLIASSYRFRFWIVYVFLDARAYFHRYHVFFPFKYRIFLSFAFSFLSFPILWIPFMPCVCGFLFEFFGYCVTNNSNIYGLLITEKQISWGFFREVILRSFCVIIMRFMVWRYLCISTSANA